MESDVESSFKNKHQGYYRLNEHSSSSRDHAPQICCSLPGIFNRGIGYCHIENARDIGLTS